MFFANVMDENGNVVWSGKSSSAVKAATEMVAEAEVHSIELDGTCQFVAEIYFLAGDVERHDDFDELMDSINAGGGIESVVILQHSGGTAVNARATMGANVVPAANCVNLDPVKKKRAKANPAKVAPQQSVPSAPKLVAAKPFRAVVYDRTQQPQWTGEGSTLEVLAYCMFEEAARAGANLGGSDVLAAMVSGRSEIFKKWEDLQKRFLDPVTVTSVMVYDSSTGLNTLAECSATVQIPQGVQPVDVDAIAFSGVTSNPSGGFELADISEFGLGERPEHVQIGGIVEGGEAAEELSPTALVLDRWERRRGRDMLASFKGAIPMAEEPAAHALADFFAAAYQPEPILAEKCVDQQRREFLEQLLETPEYHALHARTAIDEVASELACGSFAESYGKLVAETKTQEEQQGGQPCQGGGKNAFKKKMKIVSAIGKGLAGASNAVADYEDARDAFGAGLGNGAGGKMDTKALANLFKRVRDNRDLARICELAGRYRRRGQSMQRRKIVHGRDDVVGIELSGELARVVPNELACLMVPELELLQLRKLVEGQLLSREYRGVERIARGPVMIFLDESGSMSGEPSYHAKAFALAMAWIAQHQKRWCTLVAFSGGTGRDEMRSIVLEPGKWKSDDLFKWLEGFIGGGTTIEWLDRTHMEGLYKSTGAPEGKTDVIIVTDAEVGLSEAARRSCLAWKADSKAKIISLIIGCSKAGALEHVSDRWYAVPSLDVDSEAVGEAFSI